MVSLYTHAAAPCQRADSSLGSVKRNGVDKSVEIVGEPGNLVAVAVDHLDGTDGVQVVNTNLGVALDVNDAKLAVFCPALVRACGAVVVEEGVVARAVHEDSLRIEDPQTPTEAAVGALALARSDEVGVIQ